MYSWPPKYPQPTLLISNLQTGPYYLQQQSLLSLYKLVPLQREPETLQTSPQMRIYDESNPNQYIEKSDDAIMKGFTKFLEENPDKISKLSTSNIKISYKILAGNNLSLSFDFEHSNRQNQDTITFINAIDETHIITKNADIKKLEEKRQIILPYSDSESPASHIFTPQEVSDAIKKYVKTKGKIPTHNLIITTDQDGNLSFEESSEKVKSGEYFVVKSTNGDTTLTIGNKTKEELTKIIKEAEEGRAKLEAEGRAKREAEERAKREAEERAKKEAEEKAKREAEERAKKEAEEKAKKEAEERAKRETEEKAKREAEERANRETVDRIAEQLGQAELFLEIFNKDLNPTDKKLIDGDATSIGASAPVESNTEIHKEAVEITKIDEIRIIIKSIIESAQSNQQSGSALKLIESTDHKKSASAIASINKSTFDCARSPKKENFYEILTENGEAKAGLIDYLAQYDDSKKSEKLESLVKLIIGINQSYQKKPEEQSADKAKIMEDLIIKLGIKILENNKVAESEFNANMIVLAESNATENKDHEENAGQLKPALTSKLLKTTKKLTEFLEKTGFTEESLKKIIAERSPDSQLNANSVENLSAQANTRS